MKTAYLAGPFTADPQKLVAANIDAAIAAQAALMEMGYPVFSPHTNYGHGQAACDYEAVMTMCLAHLAKCKLLVLLPGWKKSPGACREYRFAVGRGIPRYFWPEDEMILRRDKGSD